VFGKIEMTEQERVVDYFHILRRHSLGFTEQKHESSCDIRCPGRDSNKMCWMGVRCFTAWNNVLGHFRVLSLCCSSTTEDSGHDARTAILYRSTW